jgi:hypothetical protein
VTLHLFFCLLLHRFRSPLECVAVLTWSRCTTAPRQSELDVVSLVNQSSGCLMALPPASPQMSAADESSGDRDDGEDSSGALTQVLSAARPVSTVGVGTEPELGAAESAASLTGGALETARDREGSVRESIARTRHLSAGVTCSHVGDRVAVGGRTAPAHAAGAGRIPIPHDGDDERGEKRQSKPGKNVQFQLEDCTGRGDSSCLPLPVAASESASSESHVPLDSAASGVADACSTPAAAPAGDAKSSTRLELERRGTSDVGCDPEAPELVRVRHVDQSAPQVVDATGSAPFTSRRGGRAGSVASSSASKQTTASFHKVGVCCSFAERSMQSVLQATTTGCGR